MESSNRDRPSIEQASHRIEEFYQRCFARFGDSSTPEISSADLPWIRTQSDAWPYGEPNPFEAMAEAADTFVAHGCQGVFKNPEKNAVLRSFGFSETEIEDFLC
jgi:hypothetical protein